MVAAVFAQYARLLHVETWDTRKPARTRVVQNGIIARMTRTIVSARRKTRKDQNRQAREEEIRIEHKATVLYRN